MGCNEKNRCVQPVSSHCVMYVGDKLKSVKDDNPKLKCGVTITDVVEVLDNEIDLLKKHLDFSKLQKKCFEFEKDKVQQWELNQMFIDKICDLDKRTSETAETKYGDIVANTVLNINCTLTNCDGKNTKKLVDLIQLFCTEIEALKRQVGQLQSQVNNSSNTLYIPNA